MTKLKWCQIVALAFAVFSPARLIAQSSAGESSIDYDRTPRPDDRTGRGKEIPGDIPQSSAVWKYNHTPINYRLGVSVGDQGGGPIRYNTRFPTAKGPSNPASYYHTAAFASVEFEFSMKNGGLILGAHSRRDLAHRGIVTRTSIRDGQTWTVKDFSFYDSGAVLGWALGARYREAIWSADFAVIYDRGGVNLGLFEAATHDVVRSQIRIEAASFRSRLHISSGSSGIFKLSAGPEIHLPLWQRVTAKSDVEIKDWVSDTVDLKGSAALGFGVMSSVRF